MESAMNRAERRKHRKLARKVTQRERPQSAAALNDRGVQRYKAHDLREAAACFKQAIQSDPSNALAYTNLGLVHWELTSRDEAIRCYRTAVALDSGLVTARVNLGSALVRLGAVAEAMEQFRVALEREPENLTARTCLADACDKLSRLDEAYRHCRIALASNPEHVGAKVILATVYRRQGRVDDAIHLLAGATPPEDDAVLGYSVQFELGKLYDARGEYPRAFHHFAEGNRILELVQRSRGACAQDFLQKVQRHREVYSAEWVASWSDATPTRATRTPVFLVGFPRSGTTLLDQILDSHPAICVLEEKPILDWLQAILDELPQHYPEMLASLRDDDVDELRRLYFHRLREYGEPDSAALLIDKLPMNIIHAGLIVRMFPEAKFILALRHPCDVCLSCFMQPFEANHAMANFCSLGDAVRLYDSVMGLWRQYVDLLPIDHYTIKYESLVADFDQEVGRLLSFLGAEWDDAVKDFSEHARSRPGRVSTPSYSQVTEPIHARAVNRWSRYRTQLSPHLSRLASHIRHLGYNLD